MDAKNRELVRVRQQKHELEKEIFRMVQASGFFNPYWGKAEDVWLDEDFGFDGSSDRTVELKKDSAIISTAIAFYPRWVKVMEADLLRAGSDKEPIPEIEKYHEQFVHFSDKVKDKIKEMATIEFKRKHPRWAQSCQTSEEVSLSTVQIKACWRAEED